MSRRGSLWRRDVIGWSLYDFANTIYSMNIVSLYLKRYIIEDLGYDDRYFDIPYAVSMGFAALLLPALGTMSDYGAKKRLFLFLFTLTCCIAVGLLAVVPPSMIALLIVLFVVANFSYEAGQPFYNALLYSVTDGREARYVSGVGVSLGYVGSIIGMILVLPFVTGEVFGLNVPGLRGWGKEASFLPTAILFAVFAIPLFLWVRERPGGLSGRPRMGAAYRKIWTTIRDTRRYPGALRFLIADYFFEDAVATVIINIGIYCSIVLHMADGEITAFLIVSTVSAVIGSFVIGLIARRVALKPLLTGIAVIWIMCLGAFVVVDSMTIIWILGSVVGIVLGGLWTVTRPMLAELVPAQELGRFFGLFSLSGRAAAVIGPLIWTSIVYLFHPDRAAGRWLGGIVGVSEPTLEFAYKLAVLSLAAMMIIGLIVLRKVPRPRGNTNA